MASKAALRDRAGLACASCQSGKEVPEFAEPCRALSSLAKWLEPIRASLLARPGQLQLQGGLGGVAPVPAAGAMAPWGS